MQLQDYIRVLQKRWWVILLVAATAAVAAYGFSKIQTPLYRSQVRYVVLFNRVDTGGNSFADKLLSSYVNLIYNKDQLEYIARQLKIDVTGAKLMENVRLQPQPNELMIVIEVDYDNPEASQRIASAIGQQLNARVVEANRNYQGEDRVSLQLAESAQVGYLSWPRTRINVLAGGILGLVLGVLLAFVLEFLDNTLKTAADVERFTQLVTVGTIPSSAAAGGRSRPRLRAAPTSGLIAQSSQRSENKRHDQ